MKNSTRKNGQSKKATADLNKTNAEAIQKILDSLHVKYTAKSGGFTIDGTDAHVYFDAVTKKYCIMSVKNSIDVFSNASIKKLQAELTKVFKKTSDAPKTEVKKEAKAPKEKKVKKAKEPKQRKPVEERKPSAEFLAQMEAEKNINYNSMIKIATAPVELINLKDANNSLVKSYLGVYNKPKKEVVSVVTDTYNLLPNKMVIDPILNFLEKEKVKFIFDRFSYVNPQRMRLHLTFPQIKISDDSKDGILSSVFIHNSYNMAESFRMVAGGMRQVCSNGLVIGTVVKKLKVIHQASEIQAIATANIQSVLEGFANNTDLIQKRIKELIKTKATIALIADLVHKFSFEVRISAHLLRALGLMEEDQPNNMAIEIVDGLSSKQVLSQSEYDIYNIMTAFISHQILQRYRVDYLNRLPKIFSL